jgi:uncharacterized membrane protein YdfJ with MMPL/SSD domain
VPAWASWTTDSHSSGPVAVLLGLLLALVVLLRALVAPVHMVLMTLPSYGAAFGLTTVLGRTNWWPSRCGRERCPDRLRLT